MTNPNPDVRRYLREVGKRLNLPHRQKRETLRRLSRDLENFADDFEGSADYDVIRSHFGAPEEIAADFQSSGTASFALNNRLWAAALVIASLALITAVLGFVYRNYGPERPPIPEVTIRQVQEFSGHKSVNFYAKGGKPLLSVTVSGSFEGGGEKAIPQESEIMVEIHDPDVKLESKSSYISGSTIYGCTTVTYGGETTTQTVTLSCNAQGKLS